jgi:hypothetical protein
VARGMVPVQEGPKGWEEGVVGSVAHHSSNPLNTASSGSL